MAKLAPRHHGPFEVIQVMSPVNYYLKLPVQWTIHDIFHTDLLTPYCETHVHSANYEHPPPELVDGIKEYEVKRILDSCQCGRGHKLQYLVKWKGYTDSKNQWVSWNDLHANEVIREFQKTNPAAETHIKAMWTASILDNIFQPLMDHILLTIIDINAIPHVQTLTTLTNYDKNNNVDNPLCSEVEHIWAAAEQWECNIAADLAEAHWHFPMPEQGQLKKDVNRQPIMTASSPGVEDGPAEGCTKDSEQEVGAGRTVTTASPHLPPFIDISTDLGDESSYHDPTVLCS
jgi:hypothetical protein